MTNTGNIKWYMTAEVAKALRSKQLAFIADRNRYGDVHYEVTNTAPYRTMHAARELAHKHSAVARELGIPEAVRQDRLGLRIYPPMLIAAAIGDPCDWSQGALWPRHVAAVAEMEAAFGPIRRRAAKDVAA